MAEEKLQEMSFWDHLDALRDVLVRIAVVVTLVTIALFVAMPSIFDAVILAPCRGDFVLYRCFEAITAMVPQLPPFSAAGFHVELINIQLASQFIASSITSSVISSAVSTFFTSGYPMSI